MPRLLDLFCGEGGAGAGYAAAGFEVVGVDIEPQAHYPFEFCQADALGALEDLGEGGGSFDAIHASPPCQAFSALSVMPNAREHPDLLEPVRRLLIASGLPYVIENVVGAPLLDPVTMCGSMFGLGAGGRQLRRHRLFECSFYVMRASCQHRGSSLGLYGDHARTDRRSRRISDGQLSRPDSLIAGREAMAMPWATWRGITQAIPPAYTEHIGGYLMAEVRARAAA